MTNYDISHNNIVGNTQYGFYSNVPDQTYTIDYNYRGRTPCPGFVAGPDLGADTNTANFVDHFAYTTLNGWLDETTPGANACIAAPTCYQPQCGQTITGDRKLCENLSCPDTDVALYMDANSTLDGSGFTITPKAGTPAIWIVNKNNVTLKNVKLQGTNNAGNGILLYAQGNQTIENLMLDNVTINNFSNGFYAGYTYLKNATVKNSHFDNNGNGFYVNNDVENLTLTDNTFNNNTDYGLTLNNYQTAGKVLNAASSNNSFDGSNYGLYLIGKMNGSIIDGTYTFGNNKNVALQVAASDVTLKDLTLQGINDGGVGVKIMINSAAQTLENLTIDNVTAKNFSIGLGSRYTTLKNSTIINSHFDNNAGHGLYFGYAPSVYNLKLANNTFLNNAEYGMYLENAQTTDPVLTVDSLNNDVSGSRFGLYLIGPMNGLTVDNTTFSFGNNKAVALQVASNDLTVKNLTLQGVNDGGHGIMLSLNSSTQTLENLTIDNVTANNFSV